MQGPTFYFLAINVDQEQIAWSFMRLNHNLYKIVALDY